MTEFRSASAEDLEEILRLMCRYYQEDGYPFDQARSREAASRLLHDPSLGHLWVAVDSSRFVGYLAVTLGFSLEYQGRDAFVDELFLAEEARGQGLGRKALYLAESYCREQGVQALHLEVESHRTRARELYRRSGFEGNDRALLTKRLRD